MQGWDHGWTRQDSLAPYLRVELIHRYRPTAIAERNEISEMPLYVVTGGMDPFT